MSNNPKSAGTCQVCARVFSLVRKPPVIRPHGACQGSAFAPIQVSTTQNERIRDRFVGQCATARARLEAVKRGTAHPQLTGIAALRAHLEGTEAAIDRESPAYIAWRQKEISALTAGVSELEKTLYWLDQARLYVNTPVTLKRQQPRTEPYPVGTQFIDRDACVATVIELAAPPPRTSIKYRRVAPTYLGTVENDPKKYRYSQNEVTRGIKKYIIKQPESAINPVHVIQAPEF